MFLTSTNKISPMQDSRKTSRAKESSDSQIQLDFDDSPSGKLVSFSEKSAQISKEQRFSKYDKVLSSERFLLDHDQLEM